MNYRLSRHQFAKCYIFEKRRRKNVQMDLKLWTSHGDCTDVSENEVTVLHIKGNKWVSRLIA